MAPPPPLSQHLPRTGGGGRNSAILASPAWRGSGQRRPIAFRFLSYFWVVFPYDLLPDRLRPVDLPLGQVSKWHAIGVTIGALTVQFTMYVIKEFSRSWRPFHRKRSPSPRTGGEGSGHSWRSSIPKANLSGTSEDKRTFCPLRISSFKRSAFRNSSVFKEALINSALPS